MKLQSLAIFSIAVFASAAWADDSALQSNIFLDSYYAFDSRDSGGEFRPYTTQAGKDEEYGLNLGSAGVSFDDKSIRAKVVGQYGDSVKLNYAAEPRRGWQYFQESYAGVYLDPDTTLDAGIFLSHIGAESWSSKDNLNYTRSLIAEYSPYYEAGGRLSHTFNDRWSGQILLLNGWQNISEERHPALGTQLVWKESPRWTVASNTFVGDENRGTRLFHDLIVTRTLDGGATVTGSIDVGFQDQTGSNSTWWGFALMAKQPVADKVSLNARIEEYTDLDQAIAASVTSAPFKLYGGSVGADFDLGKGFLFRAEVKQMWSPNDVFLDDGKKVSNDTLVVGSLSFAFST